MTKQERRGWFVVAALFVTLLVLFGGGLNTFSVFFTPLLKEFGWSRARLSTLQSSLAVSAGLGAPLVGWLLDRIEARAVIAAGSFLSGLALVGISQGHSYGFLLVCFVLLGIGVSASTVLPCSLVIANWFDDRRGIAMGVTFAGTSFGGMVMTLVANYAIASSGWRAGYLTLAAPMFLVVIPLVFAVVRTRPPGSVQMTVSEHSDTLPGLELSQALRTRSFWLLAFAVFCANFSAAGAVTHLVAYLIGRGFAATSGALVLSIVFGLTSVGKLAMGTFADRIGGRSALSLNFLLTSVGAALLLGVGSAPLLGLFVIIFGFTLGAPLVLAPMVFVDSLGLKRFGTITGVSGVLSTLGAAVGPVVAGRIYDLSSSYTPAIVMFALMWLLAAGAVSSCLPLGEEESRLEKVAVSA